MHLLLIDRTYLLREREREKKFFSNLQYIQVFLINKTKPNFQCIPNGAVDLFARFTDSNSINITRRAK